MNHRRRLTKRFRIMREALRYLSDPSVYYDGHGNSGVFGVCCIRCLAINALGGEVIEQRAYPEKEQKP